MRCLGLRIMVALLLLGPAAGYGQQAIPSIVGTSLSGRSLRLPADLPPGRSLLIVGFSRKSGDGAKEWGRQLSLLSSYKVSYFQTPVMASLPRLLRGMVLGNIRKDVPAREQDFFVPIFDQEQQWKQTVSYSSPDDPYLVVVDQQGVIQWQAHGPPSRERLAALLRALTQ